MNVRKAGRKRIKLTARKAIACFLVTVFIADSASSVGGTAVSVSSRVGSDLLASSVVLSEDLAPALFLSEPRKRDLLKAALVCNAIEARTRYGGRAPGLEEIKSWARTCPTEGGFEDIALLSLDDEVYILHGSTLIRYHDPGSASSQLLGDPSAFGSPRVFFSERLSPQLERVIYTDAVARRVEIHEGVIDIFRHVARKGGQEGSVDIELSSFEISRGQYPICELDPVTEVLRVHPEFALDITDIGRTRAGFPYVFSDGTVRWISLDEGIAYRAAMHEFDLPGREGRGHLHVDEQGVWHISRDAEQANMTGRRYRTVNDAMWLWYLHSYKISDRVRYDNEMFRQRINWIFTSENDNARAARMEFPVLLRDERARTEAIRLALLINDMFFRARRDSGVDTLPAYERPDALKWMVSVAEYHRPGQDRLRATEGERTRTGPGTELPGSAQRKVFVDRASRELTEREAEVRAAVEVQEELLAIGTELDAIIVAHKREPGNVEKSELARRETRLIARLRELYSDIRADIPPGKSYQEYRSALKELKEARGALYVSLERADADGNVPALRRLNLEAIKKNRLILKHQVLLAGLFLTGASALRHPGLGRYAALWTLQGAPSSKKPSVSDESAGESEERTMAYYGAMYSAMELEQELWYRRDRLLAARRVEKINVTDWSGNVVHTFKLEHFDIEARPVREGDDATTKVIVRQMKPVNVHTRLDSIRRAFKRGDISQAVERLGTLIAMYDLRYIVALERYKDIASDLKRIRRMMLGLPEAHAPPEDILPEVTRMIEQVKSVIRHPKQMVWMDVPYRSLPKAFRGKLKAIAGYYSNDRPAVMKYKRDMENYLAKVETARKRGVLSQRNRKMIFNGLQRFYEWSGRGFVGQKTMITEHRSVMLEIFSAERVDLDKAAHYLKKMITLLQSRLRDIDRRIDTTKVKAAALYVEHRDADVPRRIDLVKKAISDGDIEGALIELEDLRSEYFGHEFTEPGYKRADPLIRRAGVTLSTARGLEGVVRERNLQKARETLQLAREDVRHKRSFRVTVIPPDNVPRYRFLYPGITASSLFNSISRSGDSQTERTVRSWLRQGDPERRISDNLVIRSSKPFRATEGERYRTAGPGTDEYEETGEVLCLAVTEQVERNRVFLGQLLSQKDSPVRVRVPIEALIATGDENARLFLSGLTGSILGQRTSVSVEIFAARRENARLVSEKVYAHYGIEKEEFPYHPDRGNTLTLFPVDPDETLLPGGLFEMVGSDMRLSPTETIMMPVGLYGKGQDLSGLIRGTLLGLRLIRISRDRAAGKADRVFVAETLEDLETLFLTTGGKKFDLTEQDLIALATGNINELTYALNRLIALLPARVMDAEQLRLMYENAQRVLIAA